MTLLCALPHHAKDRRIARIDHQACALRIPSSCQSSCQQEYRRSCRAAELQSCKAAKMQSCREMQ
ncbi:uncharacterized protein EKO05_0006795 [Ascochyta rabiei]|uniref:uncharacterized protein n=1 Tax=Didymella rabiei TaxID=5454 RepID=UPI0021FF0595|nr:uncharacterized protein EKO05_0006795 [Ascochyta rabiei]UPX16390.1 hypothetical protein EKO05_0006795 [Ascochyta rabiei]